VDSSTRHGRATRRNPWARVSSHHRSDLNCQTNPCRLDLVRLMLLFAVSAAAFCFQFFEVRRDQRVPIKSLVHAERVVCCSRRRIAGCVISPSSGKKISTNLNSQWFLSLLSYDQIKKKQKGSQSHCSTGSHREECDMAYGRKQLRASSCK
jgi:hypothetical protein